MLRNVFFSVLCLSLVAVGNEVYGLDARDQLAPLLEAEDHLRSSQDPSVDEQDPSVDEIVKPETKHLTLVMVGDTGYAPSHAKPLINGVFKYGNFQTYPQTTSLIKDQINGDINFANMETVISASSQLRAYPKKYVFATHPNGARHLIDIGFNAFSLANNHSYDYRELGVRETLHHADALKQHGLLAHAGLGLDHESAGRPATFSRNGVRVALSAVGIGAGFNGHQRATEKRPGQLSLYSKSDREFLSNALKNAEVDLRLLSIHRGPEGKIRVTGQERNSVRNLMRESGADVMIGHHAHVARGIEMMGDKLIVYGLGNFLHHGTANMNGRKGCKDYSILLRAHFVQNTDYVVKLAALEALPIQSTHNRTEPMKPKQSARRIGILNGLARQFDNARTGSKGVRFMARADGSGLYCTPHSMNHPETQAICSSFSIQKIASDKRSAQALRSCGREGLPVRVSSKPGKSVATLANFDASFRLRNKSAKAHTVSLSDVPQVASKHQSGLRQVSRNPAHWPEGLPLAWIVPGSETKQERARRWARKQWSLAEIEKYLRKHGKIR